MSKAKPKRKKTVIQTHHIRYPNPQTREEGWTVRIYKGEHFLLTMLARRKKVSFGFVAALREWLRENEGHAKQLFCDAFFKTGLIFDVNVLDKFTDSLYQDSFHTLVKTDRRLPYVHVRDFRDTNGFEFKSGDRSHPNCFEFIIRYQSQFERARELFEGLAKSLEGLVGGGGNGSRPLKEDYSS